MSKNHFIISSNLKNHIWKDLITDDIIAVFELVKNSYDAEANNVIIEFQEDAIIISDDGYWMSYDDIKNKWLFVWYSSKTDKDDKWIIKETKKRRKNLQRSYAWAKGVGRFACDRLSSKLTLYSKQDWWEESKLVVPRDKFEENMNTEFWSIEVDLTRSDDQKIKSYWTVLILSWLRSNRDRSKKLKLKRQLMQLISPFKEKDNDDFCISIISNDEIDDDKKKERDLDKVNWPIVNTALESIAKYTVYIDFVYNNWQVTLNLYDRWRFVFKYNKKTNDNYSQLEMITGTIYYLNKTAKSEFKKLTWEDNVSYGSIFLFKNTIRIYPFWEEWDDTLKIDRRKQQWYARYLWTRDLLGFIDVKDTQNVLIEKTSRDSWFLENEAYNQLIEFIKNEWLYKLEKYVVDALAWTESRENNEIYNIEDRTEEFKDFIKKLLKEKNIEITLWDEFKEIIKEKDIVWNLREKTKWTYLNKEINDVISLLKKSNEQKKEIEKENDEHIKIINSNENKIAILEHQNEFLQDTQNIKKEDLIGNIHDIWIIIDNIDVQVFNLLQEKEYWNKQFEDIYVNIQKIKSIVSCATNAKFSTHTWSIVEKNIVNFIHEGLYSLTKKWSIRIEYTDNSDNVWHIIKFNPLDIYTILLNLVSNSKRAKSKIINVFFEKTESKLLIYYNDNGIWIDDNIKNNIFNLWFTTTSWSWVWLFIIKKIINWIWWTIEVYDNSNSWKWALWWATFLITI